ncbi:MAG: Fe-S cluster protein [Candidatus Zixiibacteriota bacterium]|nr:MAG: Fe-S cluster protein [candidate division Zixibacteria bacterium]
MDIYKEEVMDHSEHPRNQGSFDNVLIKDGQVGQILEGRDSNVSCGDMVQFQLRVEDGKIVEVKWKGVGCAIATASASKLSEYLKGQALEDVREMSEEEMVEKGIGFSVNPGREKCLMLPVKVVRKILES